MIKLRNKNFLCGLAVMAMACCSCANGHGSPWLGNWQMREYRCPDGKVQKVDSVFYGFQKETFWSRYMTDDGNYGELSGYYKEEGDSLTITLWQINPDNVYYKKWFGWGKEGKRSFKVVQLKSNKMRLSYKDTVYVFRKY